ncbi:Acetyl-CoA acetyltransferase, mitochondrial [Hondaea fermentalgiana]|uniref:acetyl-CoA C-acetyltransferase n=1 Tax=Hondaea fermentalgiana TaxID=2315210 RepID=A0A2R5GK20_9STRA|nr:Acetyl-CoA acetyltransferase, mitochondrial [Hondaea fermentalgiana]|eukprot:GBG31230.1 Acetyl-CoA acetyltransferase, mitochondrial [Hondaea fermentalgiana]
MSRTPVGCFQSALSSVKAPELGQIAVRGALASAKIDASEVEEVYFGNVLQAGVGQAPARQVALGAGMGLNTPCTTVNKVCASGLKATMMAAQAIALGDREIMISGGMESMSNTPHYMYLRKPTGFGASTAIDSIQHDGLWDVYDKEIMGACTERLVEEMGISREDQDAYAISSYERARKAQADGIFANEISRVEIKDRKGNVTVVEEDEECKRFKPEKFGSLPTAFKRNGGTITAANASKINDGAAALVLMSEEEARNRGLQPLARIVGYEDAAVDPYRFGVAPALAVNKLVSRLGMTLGDIEYHEINEAFSAVALANMELMNIDRDRINIHGGGVSLGHPIGASGSRIVMALLTALHSRDASIGVASICNGGGGASALMVERLA